MIAGSAEKSEIRQIIEKFNVNIKQDRIFVVDLEYYCTTIVKQKLYELASCCMQDRILEKLNTKILFIENLLNYKYPKVAEFSQNIIMKFFF